ncbi:MAG: hypothetical protein CMJ48_10460, partial [Planctomycetaceae bacterium]|nr:hypothetical protein [Planctomycetaceae bacterium]
VSGTNKAGFQDTAIVEWSTLWWILKLSLCLLAAGAVFLSVLTMRRAIFDSTLPRWVPYFTIPSAVGLTAFAFWLVVQRPDLQIGDSSLRILWQLIKATSAGLVLLVGCMLLFKKRAGIVLMHGGIIMIMANQLYVWSSAVEAFMRIEDGQTVNYVSDTESVELAIVDTSGKDEDKVAVVPSRFLESEKTTKHKALPLDIKVVKYVANSDLREAPADSKSPADSGYGKVYEIKEVDTSVGTDTDGAADYPSAYVTLTHKETAKEVGTYLLSAYLTHPETITLDGKTYEVALRFKRTYKPYSLHLLEAREDDYVGTNTPMNYSSEVNLVDGSRGIERENIRIWMNNPLRYAGETFYQSGFNQIPQSDPVTGRPTGKMSAVTTLQVVTNPGWMIPYVGTMIVVVGMLAHFGLTMLRFLKRRAREDVPDAPVFEEGTPWDARRIVGLAVPSVVVLVCVAWIGMQARVPRPDAKGPTKGMRLYEFGKIPIVYEGRIKPLDTLARNSLTQLSNNDSFRDTAGNKQPAIRWFLDLAADPERAKRHRVFRIENLDVLHLLGLAWRKGHCYSLSEFEERLEAFAERSQKAGERPAKSRDIVDRKILAFNAKFQHYRLLELAFHAIELPDELPKLPTESEINTGSEKAKASLDKVRDVLEKLRAARQFDERFERFEPPLAVPRLDADADSGKTPWRPYNSAWTDAWLALHANSEDEASADPVVNWKRLLAVSGIEVTTNPEDANPVALGWNEVFKTYKDGDAEGFNTAVAKLQAFYQTSPPEGVEVAKADFEAYFGNLRTFETSSYMYLIAFAFAFLGMLGWSGVMNRTAFWLVVVALLLHSFAICGRIYISGRPPVTNLYSSAVFIAWGAAVFGLVLEVIYRMGIGSIIAGALGFGGLQVASYLAVDGDTVEVMRAVLDTQFWLTLHVICIALGYVATFVAGGLAVDYIVHTFISSMRGKITDRSDENRNTPTTLIRMTYGTLCFAIFFSFWGTVLGGLWADDSWGRFWGWDPKENGALLIVMANAIALHARWGKLVGDRGFAALAVAGNIITAWSWFGVNELGVGLHAYGFTEGVLLSLIVFAATQLAVIGLAYIPVGNRANVAGGPPSE